MHYTSVEPVIATLPAPNTTLIVLIDPISTSCRIAQEITKRGHHILALWTSNYVGDTPDDNKRDIRSPAKYGCPSLTYRIELYEGQDFTSTTSLTTDDIHAVKDVVQGAAHSNNLHIIGCYPGNGTKISGELADDLAKQLGLNTCLGPPLANDKNVSPLSKVEEEGSAPLDVRNKNVQQIILNKSNVRSIHQVCGTSIKDPSITNFLENENYPIVIKPAYKSTLYMDGGGGGGSTIKLCYSKEEAIEHFNHLITTVGGGGGISSSDSKQEKVEVVCQEYLRGIEIIVDNISYQSKHKTTMIYQYDKRSANGERSVYFGMIPLSSDAHEASLVIPYVHSCLDALGVMNGPTHAKCILTSDGKGPVLLELNVRCHGGDGSWSHLAKALTRPQKYSQIEASVDVYLNDGAAFDALPAVPRSPYTAYGYQVHLVSYSEGVVQSTPGFEVMKGLPSFVSLSSSVTVGSTVHYTTSLDTSPGVCLLMHKDEMTLKKDVEFVRYLEEINRLFTYKSRVESLARPTAKTFGLAHSNTAPGSSSGHRRIKSHNVDHFGEKPSLLRILSNDNKMARQSAMKMKRMTTVDATKEVVVIIDPYSTGCLVANEMASRGYRVIALWTIGFAEEMKSHVPLAAGKMKYHAEITEQDTLADTVKAIYKAAGTLRVVCVIPGGEAGVDCADAVSERMNLRTNGTQIANRRDKKIQQELIKDAGMRSVRQAVGKKWSDVEDFLLHEPHPVVIKPTDSAGSDGVKLCHNIEESREHFHHLFEVESVNGGFNTEVLCQEFLKGKEYVIDQVSREGVHKTMMVWVYDKRPANNSAFVYFGMLPVDPNSMEAKILVPYARGVLDVLGVKNGPSHGEVILTPTGPCLVEMNVRAHGGDGNWRSLARGLTGGYSQVEVTVDSYLDKKSFSLIPDQPPSPFKASGQEVILVSFSRGKVIATPGYDVIRELESFCYMETGIKVGSQVERTVDLLTGIGSVILLHEDEEVVKNDIAKIREMEKNNELFEYEKSGAMFTAASQRHLSEMIVEEGDEL